MKRIFITDWSKESEMYFTDDPESDFLRHDWEQEEWLESRPLCEVCGERIQDETAFYLDQFGWICEDCIKHSERHIGD